MNKSLKDKPSFGHLIALALIVVAGLFIQRGYMNEYPSHIHAWAEQDHYALSVGFINNGFDFFHPETMIYNKQFPGWWKEASETTITSADFPIHEYIVALLMRLFDTDAPWVFRFWTLFIAFVGLFFLFKISYFITRDWPKSMLVVIVAMTSPIVAYYMNGFLPGIPALSMSIVGLWFYLKYHEGEQIKHFHLSVAFLTLALLMRTTFAIALIAMLCFEMLRVIRKETTFLNKLPSVVLAIAAYLASFLWNRHLRLTHGTIFLNNLLPPESWQDAQELITEAYNNWAFQYFQHLHYWLFLVFALFAIAFAVFHAIAKKKHTDSASAKQPLSLWWLPAIQLFGCLLFTVAMMQQIQYHDYYFIDTFLLPLLLLLALSLKAIPASKRTIIFITECLVVAVLAVVMIRNVVETQTTRRLQENHGEISYNNFKDADQLLDSLNVPKNAKILCLFGYAQNGPFIQMKRKGYSVMTDDKELIEAAFTWDFDYIVIENSKFETYLERQRDMLSRLQRVGGNGKLSVCTPTHHTTYQSANEFFDAKE